MNDERLDVKITFDINNVETHNYMMKFDFTIMFYVNFGELITENNYISKETNKKIFVKNNWQSEGF